MATINQLVSEIAHTIGRPNNEAVREAIKLAIITTRNELIRRSYENHNYVDKGLTQRFKVELTTVNDGELEIETPVKVKRTLHPVPRPVRLVNNLPFDRVSTVGFKTNREIPFVKETTARFVGSLPGMCKTNAYDYINGYIYIFPSGNKPIEHDYIVIESAFEHPNPIDIENGITTELEVEFDENEYLLPEDMIGAIKEILFKRDLINNVRETNEISEKSKFNVE